MASKHCLDTVGALIRALELQPEALASVLTDDAKWWYPKSAIERGFVSTAFVEGRDAVVDGLRVSGFRTVKFTTLHVVEDGEMVALHLRADGETHIDREYSNEYAILLRLDEGRIAELWEYTDTAYSYSRMM